MPAAGVVHVGRHDHALVEAGDPRTWKVVRVQLAETFGDDVEVISGVREGDRVMGNGAILMKMYIGKVTQQQPGPAAPAAAAKDGRP